MLKTAGIAVVGGSFRARRPAVKVVKPRKSALPRVEDPAPADAELIAAAEAAVRRNSRVKTAWEEVPGMVESLVRSGVPVAGPGDFFSSPRLMAAKIAEAIVAVSDRIDLSGLPKTAYDSPTTGLFTPSIPVDAFNRVVWNDVWGANPFGSRQAYGTNEQQLGTNPQIAAAVSGLVAGAGSMRGSSKVSPIDVAEAAGTAAGTGWLGGLVLGRTVGALAGMSPESQKRLQDVGLWGGLLTGAVKSVFGGAK